VRKYYVEQMLTHQADLQKLRPLIENMLGNNLST
jgi:hypothetical protein